MGAFKENQAASRRESVQEHPNDDGDDEDEEEEDEEGKDEYERDGFVVDEVDEEELHHMEEFKKKKRKKRITEEAYQLDEEDYELLRESGLTYHRPPRTVGDKFKRLKRASADIPGTQAARQNKQRPETAEDCLGRILFGDDEEPGDSPIGNEQKDIEDEEELEEADDMTDFIVEVDETLDEDGLQSRGRRKGRNKTPKAISGTSAAALQEAHDIFGSVSDLLGDQWSYNRKSLPVDEDHSPLPMKLLEKAYEPSILEEKYLTEYDDHVRDKDVPERLQLLAEAVGFVQGRESAIREAEWIYNKADKELNIHAEGSDRIELLNQVVNVLQLVHDTKLEIPFIGMYRKELCLALIHNSAKTVERDAEEQKIKCYRGLWEIHHWDKRWRALQKRKSTIGQRFKAHAHLDAGEKGQLLSALLVGLEAAQSDEAVEDLNAKFKLHFYLEEVEGGNGQFKRPIRRSFYCICLESGLETVSGYFGLTAQQFGENLSSLYKKHEPDDPPSTPEEIANMHLNKEFGNWQSVLKGARHMMAIRMSVEPSVRDHIRSVYVENSAVFTSPTKLGNKAIDSSHQYAAVKWLHQKPIDKFNDGQWLLIQKAEEESLLQVHVGLPQDYVEKELQPGLISMYTSDRVSSTAKLWNEQREQILKEVLESFLISYMEIEIRRLLTTQAKEWVAKRWQEDFWKIVCVAPYYQPFKEGDPDAIARVLACCWGPGKPATTFVMLDSEGGVIGTLYSGHLTYLAKSPEQQQLMAADSERLLQFVRHHKPHVAVLGAANTSCRHLQGRIMEVARAMISTYPRDMAEGLEDTMPVILADESIALLYENSHISEEQFPDQPGIVRRAIALGRYLQNPLAMVANLFGPSREILSLKLHRLQQHLSDDELYDYAEQVMVTVTNQVGIDVNLAAVHDWQLAPLQFISGLGPRKSVSIKQSLKQAGRINSRKDFLSFMRRNTFVNAAGFLRVRTSSCDSVAMLDPLDDTRIHPESYHLAKRMAIVAYCEEKGEEPKDVDDEIAEMAVQHVRENPHVLNNLLVEEYCNAELDGDSDNKLQTMYDIKNELLHGYEDYRPKFKEPTEDVWFYWLSGETKETIHEGKVVKALVRNVLGSKILCNLDSGLLGVLRNDDGSNILEGSILTCKIFQIRAESCSVDLVLCDDTTMEEMEQDPYYREDKSPLDNNQEQEKRKVEDTKIRPRMIVHPFFKNFSMQEATQFLKERKAGDAVICPSALGLSHLSLVIKIYEDIYKHICIIEHGKDVANILHLGKILKIRDETFEDLDEIVARYIDPLKGFLRIILRHRKFRKGTKDEVDDMLRREKAQEPMRIVYCISICYEHAGGLILSYLRTSRVHHEYMSVSPKGFCFRQLVFQNPDRMIAYFQKHINDPVLPPVVKDPTEKSELKSELMRSDGWGTTLNGNGGATPTGNSEWGTTLDGNSGAGWEASPNENSGWGATLNGNAGATPSGNSGWGTALIGNSGSGWGASPNGNSGWGATSGGGSDKWHQQDGQEGHGGGEHRVLGGRGDRSGRGSSGSGCFKCGESGHFARECPTGGGSGGSGGSGCFKCGESGHFARECPSGGGSGGSGCFKCGESGHFARECPSGGNTDGCRGRGRGRGRGRRDSTNNAWGGGTGSEWNKPKGSTESGWGADQHNATGNTDTANRESGEHDGWGAASTGNGGWGGGNSNANESWGTAPNNNNSTWGITDNKAPTGNDSWGIPSNDNNTLGVTDNRASVGNDGWGVTDNTGKVSKGKDTTGDTCNAGWGTASNDSNDKNDSWGSQLDKPKESTEYGW